MGDLKIHDGSDKDHDKIMEDNDTKGHEERDDGDRKRDKRDRRDKRDVREGKMDKLNEDAIVFLRKRATPDVVHYVGRLHSITELQRKRQRAQDARQGDYNERTGDPERRARKQAQNDDGDGPVDDDHSRRKDKRQYQSILREYNKYQTEDGNFVAYFMPTAAPGSVSSEQCDACCKKKRKKKCKKRRRKPCCPRPKKRCCKKRCCRKRCCKKKKKKKRRC